jgi:hypothetical protein
MTGLRSVRGLDRWLWRKGWNRGGRSPGERGPVELHETAQHEIVGLTPELAPGLSEPAQDGAVNELSADPHGNTAKH